MDNTIDPISAFNAWQSEFYRSLGDKNDRGDVTSGSGYSRYDYDETEEEDV